MLDRGGSSLERISQDRRLAEWLPEVQFQVGETRSYLIVWAGSGQGVTERVLDRSARVPCEAHGGGGWCRCVSSVRRDGWRGCEVLYSPVVADVLDRMGYREQCLRADIRPLAMGHVVAGFARTVKTVDAPSTSPEKPYEGEMAAVDALGSGDVMVVSRCEWSFWGELLSTAARYRDCRGIVIDGYTRDTTAIIEMGFPVFCRGIHPADSLGRMDVETHDVPIECGGVRVSPGDLVLGDHDGVVVIPHASG